MSYSALEQKIADIISPVIEDMNYALVAVHYQDHTLQVMAENPNTRNLGVDECAKLSREISAILDVEDPVQGAYRLEVSSPGIDRPLVRKEDFTDFAGFDTKIEITPPLDSGQKRFRGKLIGEKDNMVLLETEDQGEVALPLERVHKAKLILTDDLIKANRKTA